MQIIKYAKSNSETCSKFVDFIQSPFFLEDGNLYPDGVYYFDSEHYIKVYLHDGYIDGSQNPNGWAVQTSDGKHTEFWRMGNIERIISDYGDIEEIWDNNKLFCIKYNRIYNSVEEG